MTLPDVRLGGRISAMGLSHIRREPWPDFASFQADDYPLPLRKAAARQWWRRAREEYGSIHEFSQLSHVLSRVKAPLSFLTALARIVSDEARHTYLCAEMARALLCGEDGDFEWKAPALPWNEPPTGDEDVFRWVADAIMCSCCVGETLSRPLYEALALTTTDPIPRSVVEQILKDEQLHATFGWEALEWLAAQLEESDRSWLSTRISARLAAFERACVGDRFRLEDLAGAEVTLSEPNPAAEPNLGTQDPRRYAIIFYDTVETEILPRFSALGFDGQRLWQARAAGGGTAS